MTQWLKAIVALAEDPGSVSSTYIMTHNHLVLSSDFCGYQACTWCTYIHAEYYEYT